LPLETLKENLAEYVYNFSVGLTRANNIDHLTLVKSHALWNLLDQIECSDSPKLFIKGY